MNISKACVNILHQLAEVVEQIKPEDFCRASEALSSSTVGQHLRHTLEFFLCLENGTHTGKINYDKRGHDKVIETNKFVALATIQRIASFVESLPTTQRLELEVGYDVHSNESITVETNSLRELIYNIEHAVHHMAIMKIGIREVAPYVTITPGFGVAASTVRYKAHAMSQPQD